MDKEPEVSAMTFAARVFAAAEAGDVAQLCGMIHSSAAEEFHKAQLAAAWLCAADPTVDGAGGDDGYNRPGSQYLNSVFGVRSISEFEALPPATAVARYLNHAWPSGVSKPTARATSRVFLGEVVEGTDLVHVVFRAVMEPESWAEVLTVSRTEEGWKTMLNGGLLTRGHVSFAIGFSESE